MTTPFLITECLENIISNLIDYPNNFEIKIYTNDLYSCTLVSRFWCRISTPFLYAYPFYNHSRDTYFKLIRTLLNCIPQDEINNIYASSTKHIPPTFNYISFIRGLTFNELTLETKDIKKMHDFKSIWLSEHNPERISKEEISRIMKHLVNFICKNCNNLTTLEYSFHKSDKTPQIISLISSQKKLQQFTLMMGIYFDKWNKLNYTVLDSLSQSQNLQALEFKYILFDGVDNKTLYSLCLLKNIRSLKFNQCRGIEYLTPWAKNLQKLRVLEIIGHFIKGEDPMPVTKDLIEDFLIQSFQSSSNTLTELVLHKINFDEDFIEIFQQISLSLSHLELPKILPAELIYIFQLCTNLVYLSVILSKDEDLKGLGIFIPKTLKRIKFICEVSREYDSYKELIRCFLEEYINNGGCALKYLEVENCTIWSSSIVVTEQFGDIKIILYNMR